MTASNIIAVVLFGCLAAETAGAVDRNSCANLKSPEARLSCYDKGSKRPSVETAKSGTVEGTITWQYNDFVGTKGDVESKIILIKSPIDQSLQKLSDTERELLAFGIGPSTPGFVYSMRTDGFGRFTRDGVSEGKYTAVVISGSTRARPDDLYTKSCVEDLKQFIPDLMTQKKLYCTIIEVRAGERAQVVHDFGNTDY